MRKRIARQILSLMLALVCVLGMGITVYADAEYDSHMSQKEVIKKYSVDTGYKEGDEAFNSFLEVASTILSGDKFGSNFEALESADGMWRFSYITYEVGTDEEWEAMTTFEKLLWDYLYVAPVSALAASSYSSRLDTFELFEGQVFGGYYEALAVYDVEVAEAYKEIMEWQYNYIVENNAVYNFMTGVDSNGNKPGSGGMSPVLIIVIVVVVALAGFVVLGKKKGNSGKKAA